MKCKQDKQEKYKNVACPICSSKAIIKRGIRKTTYRGEVQRFGCKKCGKRFVADEGFWKMKNHEKKITLCMDLYYRGVSLRKIQEHLQMFYPKNSSHVSIYKWIIKYSSYISNLTDKVQINSGIELQSDEMEYHRLGEQNWFVDVMCTETRYIVSSDYMKSRTIDNLTTVLKKGKYATGNAVKIVTTDGLKGYPRVLRKAFGVNKKYKDSSRVQHNIVIASERGFNHKIERLHNSIRERTKIMRGFHGSLESARGIMKGYEIYYNYIRKHMSLKSTPAEKALPEIKYLLNDNNKWLSLIKLASKTN